MATDRTQSRSGTDSKGSKGRQQDQEELVGMTEEGVEVSASMDDDEGGLSGDTEGESSLGSESGRTTGSQSGTGGQRGSPGKNKHH